MFRSRYFAITLLLCFSSSKVGFQAGFGQFGDPHGLSLVLGFDGLAVPNHSWSFAGDELLGSVGCSPPLPSPAATTHAAPPLCIRRSGAHGQVLGQDARSGVHGLSCPWVSARPCSGGRCYWAPVSRRPAHCFQAGPAWAGPSSQPSGRGDPGFFEHLCPGTAMSALLSCGASFRPDPIPVVDALARLSLLTTLRSTLLGWSARCVARRLWGAVDRRAPAFAWRYGLSPDRLFLLREHFRDLPGAGGCLRRSRHNCFRTVLCVPCQLLRHTVLSPALLHHHHHHQASPAPLPSTSLPSPASAPGSECCICSWDCLPTWLIAFPLLLAGSVWCLPALLFFALP